MPNQSIPKPDFDPNPKTEGETHTDAEKKPEAARPQPHAAEPRLVLATTEEKPKRGTAAMDPETRKEVARKGGLAVSRNREHMASIGKKGGQSISRDREHMAKIGKKGGESSRATQRVPRPGLTTAPDLSKGVSTPESVTPMPSSTASPEKKTGTDS